MAPEVSSKFGEDGEIKTATKVLPFPELYIPRGSRYLMANELGLKDHVYDRFGARSL